MIDGTQGGAVEGRLGADYGKKIGDEALRRRICLHERDVAGLKYKTLSSFNTIGEESE